MPISLFYWYTDVDDVNGLVDRIRAEGERLKLGGRIRVSPEGLNGTVGGQDDDLEEFHEFVMNAMGSEDIDFKVSEGGAEHFRGLQVRKVKEVVTLGEGGRGATWRDAAPHLSPEEFRAELLQEDADTVVLDARNGYETAIGRFDNAITPNTRQFAQFALSLIHI